PVAPVRPHGTLAGEQRGIKRDGRDAPACRHVAAEYLLQLRFGGTARRRRKQIVRRPLRSGERTHAIYHVARTEQLVLVTALALGIQKLDGPSDPFALALQLQDGRGLEHTVEAAV